MEVHIYSEPLFTNDAIYLGLLLIVLALIFYTHDLKSAGWKKFYTLCTRSFVVLFRACFVALATWTHCLGMAQPGSSS